MLNQIKLFFEQHLSLPEPKNNEETTRLAAAVLFLEMMAMDDKVEPKERGIIQDFIQQNFALSESQTTSLIELAEQERKEATDYFQFTSLINKAYSLEQKINLIKILWRIAYADDVLDLNEEYFVRKIADLLYVPHSAFIMTKNQILE